MPHFRLILLFISLAVLPALQAKEVAGINMPDQLTLHADSTPLKLNGAGVRSKFFFSIYVGGLYLPQAATHSEAVLAMPGPKRVRMHFLYDEVSQEKLVDGWNEGFENNLDAQQLQRLQDDINRFNHLFKTVVKGDEIDLDFLPGQGTTVWINNQKQGLVAGDELILAILKIWLGQVPADEDLKAAMLGGDE